MKKKITYEALPWHIKLTRFTITYNVCLTLLLL